MFLQFFDFEKKLIAIARCRTRVPSNLMTFSISETLHFSKTKNSMFTYQEPRSASICSSETQRSWTHVRRNGKLLTGFIHSPFTKTKNVKKSDRLQRSHAITCANTINKRRGRDWGSGGSTLHSWFPLTYVGNLKCHHY